MAQHRVVRGKGKTWVFFVVFSFAAENCIPALKSACQRQHLLNLL